MNTLEELAQNQELLLLDTCCLGAKIKAEESLPVTWLYDNFDDLMNDIIETRKALQIGNCVTVKQVIDERRTLLSIIDSSSESHRKKGIKKTKRLDNVRKLRKETKENLDLLKETVVNKEDLGIPSIYNDILAQIYKINSAFFIEDSNSGADENLLALAIYLSDYENIEPTIVTGDYGIVRRLYAFEHYSRRKPKFNTKGKPINVYSNFRINHKEVDRRIDFLYRTPDEFNPELKKRMLKNIDRKIEARKAYNKASAKVAQ